jgi:glucosamine 6-phosphate synthetase-like amidotransferase/phosphosugar isomerase protein
MCGVVSFFGQSDGLIRILEALHLLEYRAPDSSGVATLTGPAGQFAVRRAVGATRRLVETLAVQPLHRGNVSAVIPSKTGRDCSPAAGYTLLDLYHSDLQVGMGDRGTADCVPLAPEQCGFSAQLCQNLQKTGALASPDFDIDAVRHAFRLTAAHVASRAGLDSDWRRALDAALQSRLPGVYPDWQTAWAAEMAVNMPGQAFAVAVRQFQQTFPGLAETLADGEWERVGGLTALAMAHIIVGHGRWAMVGAVTETNAHPITDHSQTRTVCENGSHNASLMLKFRDEQAAWWRARGLPAGESAHRTENTSEVVVYEWERAFHQITEQTMDDESAQFVIDLVEWGVVNPDEQALRLAMWRLTPGNTHACTLYSQREPGVLYVTSHRKPVAIATRVIDMGADRPPRREIMVASDVNAALMLWPGAEVDVAAARIEALQGEIQSGVADETNARIEIERIAARFTVDVIFLDANLYRGEQLVARLSNRLDSGQVMPEIRVSRYDGAPVAVVSQSMQLNPAMAGRRGFATYTESHIAEIPAIVADLMRAYVAQERVRLDSIWEDGLLRWPGLNVDRLGQHFDPDLSRLRRLLLIGEGSSWRDAQAAAPLFRELLPGVVVNIYRPVELLNLAPTIDPAGDLAVEISWSGTTDSLLKVDDVLAESGVMRLGLTGRPQSDMGRRTAPSAGTLDVRSGVEVSVATVKGFEAMLTTLDLLALQLAQLRAGASPDILAQYRNELTLVVPQHIRAVITDDNRRTRLREVARRCRHFNKVAVVGSSPIDIEGELKIEELAQIMATTVDFHGASLRALIEQTAMMPDDKQRILFVINTTTPERHQEAALVINYLNSLGVFCVIHTTPNDWVESWQALPMTELFVSPSVSDLLQPLVDAPFFFDLAVALAYARGLSPDDIDRPRNLAKSVTTTAAERRGDVEARQEYRAVSLADFAAGPLAAQAWDARLAQPARPAMRAVAALRSALAVMSDPLPEQLGLGHHHHLLVAADTEATENAAQMAVVAWQRLLGMDVTVYRRFISELPETGADTARLRFIRAGAILAVRDAETVALPTDLSPLALELLTAVYLMGLAVRLARQRGVDTMLWETGLAQLPLLVAQIFTDTGLTRQIGEALRPFVAAGYDKVQIIGGGQDHGAARSIARSLRMQGFMAESLYTDSAWHGPLAAVGGPDAEHDTLIIILATDPLFRAVALVDTQVYRTRHASVLLVTPQGQADSPDILGVEPSAVITVPAVPRPFGAVINVALGDVLARQMTRLWDEKLRQA